MTLEEMEETLTRLQAMKGVLGTLVVTSLGETIRSTLSQEVEAQVRLLTVLLVQVQEEVRGLVQLAGRGEEEGSFLRMTTARFQFITFREGAFMLVSVLRGTK